jgi:hypothetical protein
MRLHCFMPDTRLRLLSAWLQALAMLGLLLSLIVTRAVAAPPALGTPTGKALLTITGSIRQTNAPKAAIFDRAMFEALPQRKARIQTPWNSTPTAFEGPLLSALLDTVGATGTKVLVTALNDYTSEIPIDDFRKWPVMLATRMDGKPIPVREKGPLFIIYPFDKVPELYNELYFSRSVWQVKSIEVH